VNEALGTDSSGGAKYTNVANLIGTADANAVVTLKEGATVLGAAIVDVDGSWGFTPISLSQGAHTIVAAEIDL